MITLLTIVHVLVCFFLIGIVLLQHGKGADIGATFGGSSQSLFGTEGPLPLLNKITTASAVIFMVTSMALAYYSADQSTTSVMKEVVEKQQPVEDVAPTQEKDVIVPIPAESQDVTGAEEKAPSTFSEEAAKEETKQ